MTAAIVEARGLSKSFRKGGSVYSLRDAIPRAVRKVFGGKRVEDASLFWALRDVSFAVESGASLGVIGPNGAGKSTLLKILAGVLRPNEGTVAVRGRMAALIELTAGFHRDLTGRENIYLQAAIMGMSIAEVRRKFDGIVAFSGVEQFLDTPVKRYSSGMYVRLGFAIAVHLDPEILLIDEVLAVGDISYQGRCLQKIQELRSSGVTILFVSHNLEFVRRVCGRTLFLLDGRERFFGETTEAIEEYLRTASVLPEAPGAAPGAGADGATAAITGLRVLDGEGREVSECGTGARLCIEVSYETAERIVEPSFAVSFFSGGHAYADLNSRHEGFAVAAIEGKGVARVLIDRLLLLPGSYEVRAHIADRDGLGVHAARSALLFVRGARRTVMALFHQPHAWEFGPADGNF